MSKLNFVIAFIALCIAVLSYFKPVNNTSYATDNDINSTMTSFDEIELIKEQSTDLDVEQLQLVINQLNARLAKLEANQRNSAPLEQSVTEIVDAYVAKKEQEEQDRLNAQDPFHSFYQSLPDNYEERLKTDPDYAIEMQQDLKQKVLDASLSEEERLVAMAQLQMTMGMLAEYGNLENGHELSNAIMDIANNTTDEGNRIRALEVLSSGPDINPKLAPDFIDLVTNDSNNYVRNIAANGLGMMMYSGNIGVEAREQLANNIIQIMKNTEDSKLQSILQQNFGSEKDIKQSLEYIREEETR